MADFKTVRGVRMRVTRVDECGIPATGATDSVVTDGFATVSYSPEIESRDEIVEKNAGGVIYINDTTAPQLKWYDLSMEFQSVNPNLFQIITGQTVVDDYAAEPVGISIGDEIPIEGFALEVWSDIPGAGCTDGAVPYGYFLVPWAIEGFLTDLTIENAAITFGIDGRSQNYHQWGVGPYDVVEEDAINTPGPLLVPLGERKHFHIQRTLIAPPAITA